MSPNTTILDASNIDLLSTQNEESFFQNPKNPSQGVSTRLTKESARFILKFLAQQNPKNATFYKSLASTINPSPGQCYWLFSIAQEFYLKTKFGVTPVSEQKGAYIKLQDLFGSAGSKLKKPRICFKQMDGETVHNIVISLAAESGKNPGSLYVKNNDVYCGKISPLGHFSPSRDCDENTKKYLNEINYNPQECAQKYGRNTGNCCFCAKVLTDERSLEAGYGETCANNWGLPWGE